LNEAAGVCGGRGRVMGFESTERCPADRTGERPEHWRWLRLELPASIGECDAWRSRVRCHGIL